MASAFRQSELWSSRLSSDLADFMQHSTETQKKSYLHVRDQDKPACV
jgi:hypothetical protein